MMIVLYPVLVLSLVAGQGLVSAQDVTTVAPDAASTASATASAATTKVDSLPSNESPTRTDVISTIPKVAKEPSGTDQLTKPPSGEDSDNVEKAQRALDKMTKALDVSTAEGTAAVPLLAGRNYDYFLLKLQKPEEKPVEKLEEGPRRSARTLDTEGNDNSLERPSLERPADCPCVRPPPHIAPDFNAMQNIYGKSALALNSLPDSPCPPGMVPVTYDGSIPPNHGTFNDPGLAYNSDYYSDYLQPPNVSPNSPIAGPRYGAPSNVMYPLPYGQGQNLPYDQNGWLSYGHNPVNDPPPYYPYYPQYSQFSQYPPQSPYPPHTPPQLLAPKDFPRPPSEFNSVNGLRSLLE